MCPIHLYLFFVAYLKQLFFWPVLFSSDEWNYVNQLHKEKKPAGLKPYLYTVLLTSQKFCLKSHTEKVPKIFLNQSHRINPLVTVQIFNLAQAIKKHAP